MYLWKEGVEELEDVLVVEGQSLVQQDSVNIFKEAMGVHQK